MPIKVLIVDDIAETRDNVRRLLSLNDDFLVVGEANDGQVALEQVEKLRPDIVLMDINMPEMDGMTACQYIAVNHPYCGVIMMTVQGGKEYIERAFAVGAKGYVVKPFSSQELMNTIRQVYYMIKKTPGSIRKLSNYGEKFSTGSYPDLQQDKRAGANN